MSICKIGYCKFNNETYETTAQNNYAHCCDKLRRGLYTLAGIMDMDTAIARHCSGATRQCNGSWPRRHCSLR